MHKITNFKIKFHVYQIFNLSLLFALLQFFTQTGLAIELHWAGNFWAEYHFIKNYTMDGSDQGSVFDPNRAPGGTPLGYYIPAGGNTNATFQTLFLKLRPKIIVNDNIYLKSEWWLGNPATSIFGGSYPYTFEQRQFYSNQSRGSFISAQRLWGEILSDIGTIHIGRAPLDWGLGLVWNGGESLWSRFQSTGDVIRLVSKFGAFSFVPQFILYSAGNNVGGSCSYPSFGYFLGGNCIPGIGNGGVSEYALTLKYENLEEDFEGGVNFIRRLGGANQDPTSGTLGPHGVVGGMAFNTWDIYGRKKIGRFTLAGEAPITTGKVMGIDYSTFALATEVNWKSSDTWETSLKAGHAPGQSSSDVQSFDKFRAFYFHPNYRLGLILFNYQLAHFAGTPGPNTDNNSSAPSSQLRSPFDNPVVNANYLMLTETVTSDKWKFHLSWIYAHALQSAQFGKYFYNTVQKRISLLPANKNQSQSLGWELDAGTSFQWDDSFLLRWDLGFFFPGDFYRFSNGPVDNQTSVVFATALRAGITF